MTSPLGKHICVCTLFTTAACGEGSLDPNAPFDSAPTEEIDERARPEPSERESPNGATTDPLPALLDPELAPSGDVVKPDHVESSGFFTLNGRLYDRYGNDFVIRGVNNPHAWYDTGGRELALGALDAIAGYGFNAVRIVWEIDPALTPSLLRRILFRCVELEMVPMIELHDATGATEIESLLALAEYYAEDEVRTVLVEFEDYLLVNIANEWSGSEFFDGYEAAIQLLRSAGLNHTLVIDGNEWGQNSEVLFTEGPRLLEVDPQRNLLFSTHMYESYAGRRSIRGTFERASDERLPFIVGEFGHEHGGVPIDVDEILEVSSRLGFGHMGWSWTGNSAQVQHLDMTLDWEGERLTDWGERLIEGEFGIEETAQKASLFLIGEVE